MNMSHETETVHTQDRIQTLRYPALEQAGPAGIPTAALRSSSSLASLLPTEERQNKDMETAARRKIVELEAQIVKSEQQLPLISEQSRLEGEQAGRRQAGEEFAQVLSKSRASIAEALQAFEIERRDYLRCVEAEVVKLALAIARKVLHREAQMDSMLLSGVARAALDRLGESATVVLRVPPEEGGDWRKALAGMPERNRPSLVEDGRLKPGGCVLESQMGTIELSVDAQLEEIERGFFDLLEQRLSAQPTRQSCEQCGGH